MADRDKGTDIDKLLAEVDGMMSGGGPAMGAVAPSSSEQASRGRFATQVRTAGLSGAVAAVGVWCVFAVLPFLAAPSGAVGAFLGTFAGVFIFRRRR